MAEQDVSRQRPIDSPLKTKKTIYREAENPVRWAYTQLLREHDKTKKRYPINPYAEVYQFRANLFGIYTESLDGMGDPWMWLIEGPEKAFLIDTGFGIGNLPGLIKEITGDKPVMVANTHSHFDHAYGNFWFDKVYCHEYEAPLLASKMNPHIWDYLFDESGRGRWCDFDKADLVPFKEYEIRGVPDGFKFNLGGNYEIELVFLPGHSPGHAAFLDKQNRILFAGDDACVGAVGIMGAPFDTPYCEHTTVESLRNELAKIIKRADEFDGIFPSHGMVNTGVIVLSNLLEACDRVLENPKNYDTKMEHDFAFTGSKSVMYGKMIYLSGYLIYSANSVYMNRDANIE
jgi:glyoxylase-like metal-dependent hydrolase (beta-lactamase superfamily II)